MAVNADSLPVWFREVLAEIARWDDVAIRLHVEDETHSAELLRGGEVLAAVTSDPAPVQGCSARRLGALRYLPAAAPWFADRWRRGDSPDWAAMPVVIFGAKDDLQHRLLRRHGVERAAAGRPPGPGHGRLLPGGRGRPRLGDAPASRRRGPTWRPGGSRCCHRT